MKTLKKLAKVPSKSGQIGGLMKGLAPKTVKKGNAWSSLKGLGNTARQTLKNKFYKGKG